jgi:hypothetical protein
MKHSAAVVMEELQATTPQGSEHGVRVGAARAPYIKV